jgi:hypothetical protein
MNKYRITEIKHGAVGESVLAAIILTPVETSGGSPSPFTSPTVYPLALGSVLAEPFRIGGLSPSSIAGLKVNDEITFGLGLPTTPVVPEDPA